MQSYWERETLRHFDLIVVGGGIVGHSTALFYAESHPNARIAILERGLFPEGASTKNAGFACFGSIAELEHDLESLGAQRTVELVLKRFSGLQLLRQTLGDQAIDYHEVGGYELCFEAPDLERINFFNDLLEPALGARPYSVVQNNGFGFSDSVHSMIKNALEGTIDTGKMMAALQRKVAQLGVQTFTQSAVATIEDGPHGKLVCVETTSGPVELLTPQVALCTNAFSKDFLPEVDVQPGRGMVLVTKPNPAFDWEGSFHYHDGYHYFRTVDGRLLLGGGRQLDLEGESTTEAGINGRIKAQLLEDIQSFIAPGVPFEVDLCWSGTMAFGTDKNPVVQRVDDRTVAGIRLGGMGVAIGMGVGKELAGLLA